MAKTTTHNEWLLRPPPGARFVNWAGGDIMLQFERGREREVVEWLKHWIASYIEPEISREEEQRVDGGLEAVAQAAVVLEVHQPPTATSVAEAHKAPATFTTRPGYGAHNPQATCKAVDIGTKKPCELVTNHEGAHMFRNEQGVRVHFVMPGETPTNNG